MEFYINVGDWPLETRRADASPGPVPVLSWCGSTDTRDIVLPTYEVTHSTLETMRGVTNDLLSVQGNTGNSHSHSLMVSLTSLSSVVIRALDSWTFTSRLNVIDSRVQ